MISDEPVIHPSTIKAELLASCGTDIDIVNAARVSFAKESAYELVECMRCGEDLTDMIQYARFCFSCGSSDVRTVLIESDAGLINYLAKHAHGTPFEMVWVKFRFTAPIFVMREAQRHRTLSFNEVSSRYVEMEPNFYIPLLPDMRRQVGKPGNYMFETMENAAALNARGLMIDAYIDTWSQYQELLKKGVAKEVARNVLPLALETQCIVAGNLRAWMHFVALRNHERALREIQYLAEQVESHLGSVAPVAMDAFQENGRMSP